MSVGRPAAAMTLAIVIVLPLPVTPTSVWYGSPRTSPAVSSAIACGWSPRGVKGVTRWNGWPADSGDGASVLVSSKGILGEGGPAPCGTRTVGLYYRSRHVRAGGLCIKKMGGQR